MKRFIFPVVICLGLLLARALPTNGLLPDPKFGTQVIFRTNVLVISNFVYVYPKATNWINMISWPADAILVVPDLYLPNPRTWLSN